MVTGLIRKTLPRTNIGLLETFHFRLWKARQRSIDEMTPSNQSKFADSHDGTKTKQERVHSCVLLQYRSRPYPRPLFCKRISLARQREPVNGRPLKRAWWTELYKSPPCKRCSPNSVDLDYNSYPCVCVCELTRTRSSNPFHWRKPGLDTWGHLHQASV